MMTIHTHIHALQVVRSLTPHHIFAHTAVCTYVCVQFATREKFCAHNDEIETIGMTHTESTQFLDTIIIQHLHRFIAMKTLFFSLLILCSGILNTKIIDCVIDDEASSVPKFHCLLKQIFCVRIELFRFFFHSFSIHFRSS